MHCAYGLVLNVINSLNREQETRLSSELSLAIIVPILNEAKGLPILLKQLSKIKPDRIIIVDGGSVDGSVEWLNENWVSEQHLLCHSPAGRAQQMNAGVQLAQQDMLLFLHADTVLPANTKSVVCHSARPLKHWGRFDVEFDIPSFGMSVIAFFMNWRSRFSGVVTGDQAIFVHQALFRQVDGFDDIALMEDVAISKKLRKLSAPLSSHCRAITSARRWRQNGIIRTVATMWFYRLAYFIGVSPDLLAKGYRNIR